MHANVGDMPAENSLSVKDACVCGTEIYTKRSSIGKLGRASKSKCREVRI